MGILVSDKSRWGLKGWFLEFPDRCLMLALLFKKDVVKTKLEGSLKTFVGIYIYIWCKEYVWKSRHWSNIMKAWTPTLKKIIQCIDVIWFYVYCSTTYNLKFLGWNIWYEWSEGSRTEGPTDPPSASGFLSGSWSSRVCSHMAQRSSSCCHPGGQCRVSFHRNCFRLWYFFPNLVAGTTYIWGVSALLSCRCSSPSSELFTNSVPHHDLGGWLKASRQIVIVRGLLFFLKWSPQIIQTWTMLVYFVF